MYSGKEKGVKFPDTTERQSDGSKENPMGRYSAWIHPKKHVPDPAKWDDCDSGKGNPEMAAQAREQIHPAGTALRHDISLSLGSKQIKF